MVSDAWPPALGSCCRFPGACPSRAALPRVVCGLCLLAGALLAQGVGAGPERRLPPAAHWCEDRSWCASCCGCGRPLPQPDGFPLPQPDQEVVTVPDLGSLSSPLMDTERNLGLLLGLHASYLALSTPLSPVEVECASKKHSLPLASCGCFRARVCRSRWRLQSTPER